MRIANSRPRQGRSLHLVQEGVYGSGRNKMRRSSDGAWSSEDLGWERVTFSDSGWKGTR